MILADLKNDAGLQGDGMNLLPFPDRGWDLFYL
jgi:hypothetical protein